MAAVFNAGHFEQLHRILTDAKANPARVAQSNEWYIAIDRSRSELLDIARAKGPNEAEKREIQSGKVTIEGVSHSLNEDFAQQSIALSQHLQISERYAASLLQAGMQARAKWGRSAVEVGCILFHRERLAAIACLRELIGGAAELSREEDSQAQKLGAKMQQLVDAMLTTSHQGNTFVQRILGEIDSIKSSMERVHQNLRGANAGLGDEIQLQMLQMLRKERQDLGHVLYLLSITRVLGAKGILTISGWLSKVKSTDQNDSMIIYLLIVLLNALEVTSEEDDSNPLLDDRTFIKQMHAELTTKSWSFGEPQNVALLQWTLFLAEATKRSPSLASDIRVHQDTLQKLFTDAVQGNAFYSIALRILAFRQRQIDALEGEETEPSEVHTQNNNEEDEIDADFQENILEQIQNLILSITSVMLPFLRKMQRSEEDAAFAASRSGNADSSNRRYDIEALFDSVSLLCRARPDAGLAFWQGPEGKGTRFLNWAIEVREPGHQRSLFEMLASLSGGKESAWHAHSLLSSGDSSTNTTASTSFAMQQSRFVSWSRLFDWVQQFIDSYRSPAAAAHPVTSSTTAKMTSNEAIILRGFFRLLRNVAIYSVPAREALYQHSTYEIVPRLFALYTCPIMIDLKSTILDALSAFAHSSGPNAAKITEQLWTMLETSVGVTRVAGKTTLSAALHDLQAVEVPARTFPTTTSLVNLFKSLIHTPKRIDQQSIETLTGTSEESTFSGLALNLGHGQRSPGLEPYIDFVIESVLLQAGSREYSDMHEKWRVIAACLDFVERSLMSFDLNVLLGEHDLSTLASLTLHPGFSIMKRILTGTKLLQEILNIINPNAGVVGGQSGFEIINSNKANTLFFAKCVRHSMRIVQRVLQIQDIFMQVLLPTLDENSSQLTSIDVASRAGHLTSYTPLDSLLLHAHQSVVQMALYINCTRNDIALLAIRIIGLLAASTAFSGLDRFGGMGYNRKMNRFVGLLEMSDEADRIRAGCVDRLEAEADEPAADVDANVRASLALIRISGVDDEEDELQKLVPATLDADEAIRLAILDLLITNTSLSSDAPNIAHLLLGFDLRVVRPENQIVPDADAFDTPPSALHAILTLLRPDRSGATMSIAERSPAFTEKCHQLIGNLCRHPFTSTATLRYLRTKEDFFVRQLRSLSLVPVKRTSSEFGAMGKLIQPDGGHQSTTVDSLISSLHIRGHVLSMIALELHTLCNAQMWTPANRLVAVLLGRDSVLESDEEEEEDDDLALDGVRFEQGGMRLLEILSSFDFEWHDEREQENQEPTVLRNLDLSQALSSQANREFDVRATIRLLAAAHRELDRRGDLSESRRRADFHKDAALILEHVAARNARRVIAFARRMAMQAWRNTLDMTFTRANHLLEVSGRSNVILDCLSALLPRLYGATSESDPALSDLAAGAVLGLLTRLRQHQASITAEDYQADLPIDRLIATLQALIGAIIEPGTSMQARGNLYSALINFLQLVKVVPADGGNDEFADDDGASTLDGESEFDDSMSFSAFSQHGSNLRKKRISAMEVRTRSVLSAQAERLIPVIAKDALDASDVWRTVAFTLFDRLAALQGGSSSRAVTIILDILGRKGFLKSFVANLREMDIGLQEVLKPDPSTLNTLYVYEAQMAFFNRLAQSKRGAEKLVDARIFEILTQVDFLQARPQQHYPYAHEDDFADFDSFLPAIASRYEALLMPSIQLGVSILFNSSRSSQKQNGSILATFSRTSSSSSTVPRQALSFLQAHRNTLLISLKNATQDVISLTALEQAQLVISMLVFVLPMLDDDALSPPKPMAQFHQAVLAISATFLYEPHWKSRVLPFTEGERQDAAEMIDELGTLFDVNARSTVERLLSSLLAYLERASEYTGVDEFGARKVRPCLTASLYTHSARGISMTDDLADLSATTTGPGRYGFEAGGRNPNVASLGTVLAGLDENIKRCNKALTDLDKMQSMLDNVESVQLEEWDEVIAASSNDQSIIELAPGQRRLVGIRLLRSQKSKAKGDVRFYLNCIEMMLVLLYRHFAYYIELGTANAMNRKVESGSRKSVLPTVNQSSIQSATETSALVHDGERITSKVLESLEGVINLIEDESYGIQNANERKSYIEMTVRRLQGVFLNFVEES